MKKYKCHDCEGEFRAETREELLSTLFDHYMKDHPTIIPNATDDEKKAWMVEFEKNWSAAEEVTE